MKNFFTGLSIVGVAALLGVTVLGVIKAAWTYKSVALTLAVAVSLFVIYLIGAVWNVVTE